MRFKTNYRCELERLERVQRDARKVARWNGRLLLYAMTPIILLSPIFARDGQPWQFLFSVPLAMANVFLCRCVIAWGKTRAFRQFETQEEFWREAMRHVVFGYRWFGKTLTPEELDRELAGLPEWSIARKEFQPGDKIWPFLMLSGTDSRRAGYVIVRNGNFVSGVVVFDKEHP